MSLTMIMAMYATLFASWKWLNDNEFTKKNERENMHKAEKHRF